VESARCPTATVRRGKVSACPARESPLAGWFLIPASPLELLAMAAKERVDGFLQLVEGGHPLSGESTDVEFPNAIEFQSFRFGSSSGFTDSNALYAAQDTSKRGALAMSRFQDSGYQGIASLFGDDEQAEADISEQDAKEFEGKDLSDEAAANFQIVKGVDFSSPTLFRAYCTCQDLDHREVFDSATVSIRKSTGGKRSVYLKYTFNDLLVVGFTIDVGTDGTVKETINFAFAKIRCEYHKQSATGELGIAIKGGWDFIERTPW
jgi:type VI protein secretion system component Hcp